MPDEITSEITKEEKAIIDFYGTTTVEGAEPVVIAPVVPVVEVPTEPVVVAPVVAEPVVIAPVVPVVAPAAVAVETAEGFEITLGADSPLSDSDLDDIFALAEKKNLDKDETLALIKNKEDFYNKGKSNVMDQATRVLQQQEAEYLADPLFSTPAARIANEATIDAALKKYGSPKLQETFLSSHLKNNVELAKFFHNIGTALKGDEMRLLGNGSSVPTVKTSTEEDRLKLTYPEHFKN